MITDPERKAKLRQYYDFFKVEERYEVSFDRFIEMVERDTWQDLAGTKIEGVTV